MTKKKWKPHAHSDEMTRQQPTYWPGDPVLSLDGEAGRVEYARSEVVS
jgi:hypothetical protein